MGISYVESAVNKAFPSVAVYSCNFTVLLTEIIYDLPDKRAHLKSEYDSVQLKDVSLNSLQLPIL